MIASSGLQQLASQHDVAAKLPHRPQLNRARCGWLACEEPSSQADQVKSGEETACIQSSSGLAIAGAFSFNSYQDILCNEELLAVGRRSCIEAGASSYSSNLNNRNQRQLRSQSTFSASDVKRNLNQDRAANLNESGGGESNLARPAYLRAQSNCGWSTFANGAKFRVHSRHHSISRLSLLQTNGAVAADKCVYGGAGDGELSLATRENSAVAQSTRNESQVVKQVPIIKQKVALFRATSVTGAPKQQQQAADCAQNSKQLDTTKTNSNSSATQTVIQINNKQQASKMNSGTMQSIQSLSMQLNQAKARSNHAADLSQSDSGLEEASLQQNAAKGASSSAGKLGKLMGKKASRVKELVLQNLGKADRTADELFEMYEQNFYKQQAQASRLQKEFKSYVISMKGVHEASKSLNSCIQQSTGDYQSARHDLVCENLSQLEHLNDDLLDKLRGQVLVNLDEYLSQFCELKEKIAKRKRKLIDFDSSRRIYELQLVAVNKKRLQMQRNSQQQQQQPAGQTSGARSALRSAFMIGSNNPNGRQSSASDSLQTATNQLVDEARLLKLREQYNYCKVMYETINSELHEELPMVYEKKMKHLLMSLQNYFSLEAQFHSNAGKLFATASDVIDELPMSVLQAAAHLHNNNNRPLMRRSSSSLESAALAALADSTIEASTGKVAVEVEAEVCYNKPISAGSSGMGSSRGESSLDSSSSPDEDQASSSADSHENRRSPSEEREESAAQIAPQTGERQVREDEDTDQVSSPETYPAQDNKTPVETNRDNVESEPSAQVDASAETACGAADSIRDIEPPSRDANGAKKDQGVGKTSLQIGATVKDSAPKEDIFLYKVKTSYKYLAEDVDELCFEADEILQVVEFEPTQEQEEGWLMGIREVNGQRGLFPANFTQPI